VTHRALAVLAVAASLAGCSAAGTQAAGTTSTSSDAAADPIPRIRDFKNVSGIPPCSLLTPGQLGANQMDLPARPKKVVDAPGCQWHNTPHTREISIFVDVGHDVLHNVYAQREDYAVFEVTQVGGQPAIRTKNKAESTSCYFAVATAQRQTFTLRFTSLRQGLEEPCGPARELAKAVLANLPPLKG
jgi:Protein of unknown function (DUF3558)